MPAAAKSGVVAISGGGGHSLALKDDGTIVAWGCRGAGFDAGQCDVPAKASSGVIAVEAGSSASFAIVASP